MSVKEFVRKLSIRKSKSKKPNAPTAAQWASTQGLSGAQQMHSHQVDTGPTSMRSAQSQPTLSHSFSSFAAAAAASQPHNQSSSFQNPAPSMTPDQFNNYAPSTPLSDWIYEDIVLERRGKGLGFTFAGGRDRNDNGDGSIYVAKILSGGVAESDGRLRVNDSILSVNGASFVGVTHREAMDVLKATPNTVHLKVKRFGRASDNVEIVDLYRPQGRGLGFMVAGGIGSQEFDGDDGIFIMRITEGGVAERDGRLAVGDRLLAVNDISMTYMSHEEAVEILMNTRGVVKLLLAKANRTPQQFANAVPAPNNNNNNLLGPAFMNGLRPATSSPNGDPFFGHSDRWNAYQGPALSTADRAVDSSSIRGRSTPAAVQTSSSSPPPAPFMFQPNPSPGFQSPQPFTELIPRVMAGSEIPSFVKEERQVVIRKSLTAGLGFNIVGGVGGCGIFISSIVPGGAADLNGKLRKGDQLLSVNAVDLRQVTHQEATVALKAVGEAALITAQYRPEEFARLENLVREHQKQYAQMQPMEEQVQQPAAFFVKALFDYDASADPGPGRSLSFSFGDVLYVVNAGPNDEWWQARRILPWSDVSESSGLIPSRRRVEMKFASRAEPPPLEARADVESARTTSGNRRRRSSFVLSSKTPFGKSREKLQADGENRQQTNSEDRTVPTASYETVVQVQSSLARPVIIFGPLKDRINDDLTAEFPNKFSSCVPHTTRPIRRGEVDGRDYHFVRSKETMERDIKNGLFVEAGVYNDHLYGMSAEAIKHVAAQGKHCLLDVSIGAIPRLCSAEIYPITILIKPSSPMHISQWNQPISEDASRKVFSATERLFNEYGQYFTAVASADSPTDVYARVKQIIEDHSQSLIWVTSKAKPA